MIIIPLTSLTVSLMFLQVRGKIVAATKSAWPSYKYTWILITNVNGLTVDGSGGSLDGFGSSWWPCRTCPRPSVRKFILIF